jgi:hypothetical protein
MSSSLAVSRGTRARLLLPRDSWGRMMTRRMHRYLMLLGRTALCRRLRCFSSIQGRWRWMRNSIEGILGRLGVELLVRDIASLGRRSGVVSWSRFVRDVEICTSAIKGPHDAVAGLSPHSGISICASSPFSSSVSTTRTSSRPIPASGPGTGTAPPPDMTVMPSRSSGLVPVVRS